MKVSLAVTFLAVSGAVYIVSASSTEKRFIISDLKKAFDNVKDDVNNVVNQGVKDVNTAAATVKDKLQDVLNKVKQGVNGFTNQVNKDAYVVAETTFNSIQQIEGEGKCLNVLNLGIYYHTYTLFHFGSSVKKVRIF